MMKRHGKAAEKGIQREKIDWMMTWLGAQKGGNARALLPVLAQNGNELLHLFPEGLAALALGPISGPSFQRTICTYTCNTR